MTWQKKEKNEGSTRCYNLIKKEFLKAENKHANEIVRAQHAKRQGMDLKERNEQVYHEEQKEAWEEEKARLQTPDRMRQEKPVVVKKQQVQHSCIGRSRLF